MESVFGKRLKELRMRSELNQAQLADALGVSKSSIGMWETSQREPDSKVIIKIADFFGVSTDYLLGRTDNPVEGSDGYAVLDLLDGVRYISVRNEAISKKGKEIEMLKLALDNTSNLDLYASDRGSLEKAIYEKINSLEADIRNIGEDIDTHSESVMFREFMNDPSTGVFFKDFLSSPEEKREEMLRFWKYIREAEKGRKPGDKQGK